MLFRLGHVAVKHGFSCTRPVDRLGIVAIANFERPPASNSSAHFVCIFGDKSPDNRRC
jgi:hypothetical protein